jgi:hypothetical protein
MLGGFAFCRRFTSVVTRVAGAGNQCMIKSYNLPAAWTVAVFTGITGLEMITRLGSGR